MPSGRAPCKAGAPADNGGLSPAEIPLFSALGKALGQLDDPRIHAVILKSLGLTVLVLILLGAGLWETAGWLAAGLAHWVDWLARFGTLAVTLLLAWIFFPSVVTIFVGLFLEDVASAVEDRFYPGRPPARRQSLAALLVTGFRFGAVAIFLNLVLLPAYLLTLLFPPLYLLVFYAVNGYLLGRAYFELVAYRRLDERAADALRRASRGQVTLAGVLVALMLTIPVFNLFAPVVATAFALHLFEAMPRRPG